MKAVVFAGWKHDLNVVAIIRTADALGFNEVIITGRKKFQSGNFCKRSLKDWTDYKPQLKLLDSVEDIMPYIQKREYVPVTMELSETSKPVYSYKWPTNPAIIVGHEREGVPQFILDVVEKIFLPMQGLVRCMNVACAASIAMYAYSISEKENKS